MSELSAPPVSGSALSEDALTSLAAILSPVTPERFFAEHHGRRMLHVPGAADKFAAVLSWPRVSALLRGADRWSPAALQLALDSVMVAAERYCRPGADGRLVPDPGKVLGLFDQGASLVLNDLDEQSPELTGVSNLAGALETALEAKVQANLYVSRRERQAFGTHYDTHDVFAVHLEGEKLWRIYEGRGELPIEHPLFRSETRAHHEQARGRVAAEVPMRPGDLLYLPRGQYHDAIALTDRTLHIAFGAVGVIGLDVISALFERAVSEPLFRADLPRRHVPGGEEAFAEHVRTLGAALARLAAAPDMLDRLRKLQDGHRYRRPAGAAWRVTAEGFQVVPQGDGWLLVRAGKGAPIPPGLDRVVAWTIAAGRFDEAALAAAFPAFDAAARDELLRALAAMKVIAPA